MNDFASQRERANSLLRYKGPARLEVTRARGPTGITASLWTNTESAEPRNFSPFIEEDALAAAAVAARMARTVKHEANPAEGLDAALDIAHRVIVDEARSGVGKLGLELFATHSPIGRELRLKRPIEADPASLKVSWHFTVDDKFVYQSLPTNEEAWHTATREGNATSIGIEVCMNSDLGNVKACYDRAALLTAWLAYRLGIHVPSGVYQHHDWSGKDCPRVLRHKENGWNDFLAEVQRQYRNLRPVDAPLIARPADDHHHAGESPVA